jgi:membrane-bound metal-dependent hydrolase YbcI (DUF457 family)
VKLSIALFGAVLLLDLLWTLFAGSTGHLAYGLIDEPAHLATCAVALLALAALLGGRLPTRFVLAALLASVTIDVDHIPGYLGWHWMSGSLARPYSHSLLLVAVLIALGLLSRRRDLRLVSAGLAFGVSMHLLRDLATGPGVPLAWPVSSEMVTARYAFFACTLGAIALASVAPRQVANARRLGPALPLAALVLGIAVVVPAHSAVARTVSIGAYIPGGDQNPSLIDDFDAQVGREPSMILSYKEWSQAPFEEDQLEGIWEHGAVPLITWEPWGASLRGIAQGSYDGYIRDSARAAAAWGKPLMVRFGQEMNGDWFPWGGHPAIYKAAWRHIVRVFRGEGADRVRWVWTPYVNSRGGGLPFTSYYPGEKWVDWAGLDAINWGSSYPWRSFIEIIGSSYCQLQELTSKPIILAETGSGEQGGSKARWVSTMLGSNVPHMKQVRALAFWSKQDPRGDLRVDSSSSALEALRGALGRPLYGSSRRTLLRTPARLGR